MFGISSRFDSLPQEIQIHILSFLSIRDLTRICCVSKGFNVLGNDDFLWTMLSDKYFPNRQDISNKEIFLSHWIDRVYRFGDTYLIFMPRYFYIVMEGYISFEFSTYYNNRVRVTRRDNSVILGNDLFMPYSCHNIIPSVQLNHQVPEFGYRGKFSICGFSFNVNKHAITFHLNNGKNQIGIRKYYMDKFYLYTPTRRGYIDAWDRQIDFEKVYLNLS